ncbi:hypothetical protein OG288_28570 [Streptomyces tauricus]|uniref:Uncharacterized protein n=1 Tax=Streptomyces tauricus TaxID=68274 RepID=A0ABZ1JKK8_9ACTN|nr:hypothetical protein [Streptomyces tauricus]MCW8099156.1 hypothetical protein [Streptomyces tauricus]
MSTTPAVRMPRARTPAGPASWASWRISASSAPSAAPVPPSIGLPLWDPLLRARITPGPWADAGPLGHRGGVRLDGALVTGIEHVALGPGRVGRLPGHADTLVPYAECAQNSPLTSPR